MNGICTPLNEFRKRTICRIPLFPLLRATSLSVISAYLSRHNVTWLLVTDAPPPPSWSPPARAAAWSWTTATATTSTSTHAKEVARF